MKIPENFGIELRFVEMVGKGFKCYHLLNKDIIGYGQTLEEAEDDFNDKWESMRALQMIDEIEPMIERSKEKGSRFQVSTFEIEVPVKRQIYITKETQENYDSNPELRKYFNGFLGITKIEK
jgi:hypothetical protein